MGDSMSKDELAKLYDADAWDQAMESLGAMRARAEAAERERDENGKFASDMEDMNEKLQAERDAALAALERRAEEAEAEVKRLASMVKNLAESSARLTTWLGEKSDEKVEAILERDAARAEAEALRQALVRALVWVQAWSENHPGSAAEGDLDAVRRALSATPQQPASAGEEK